MTENTRFDAAYYRRYYLDPETRVTDGAQTRRQCDFLASYLKYLNQPVRRILDMGCGLGLLRDPLGEHFPGAAYKGVECSEYLCARYGWERGSVVDYRTRGKFDLVLCQDVLQYLPDGQAVKAITNLAGLCRGVLYLGVITSRDWAENCDQTRTDGEAFLRTVHWYRKHLRPHFTTLGGGLFLTRDSGLVLYELEQAETP